MNIYAAFVAACRALCAVTPVKVSRDSNEVVAGRIRLFDRKGNPTTDAKVIGRKLGVLVDPQLVAGAVITVPGFKALTDGLSVWSRELVAAKAANAGEPNNPAARAFAEALEAHYAAQRVAALDKVAELDKFRNATDAEQEAAE